MFKRAVKYQVLGVVDSDSSEDEFDYEDYLAMMQDRSEERSDDSNEISDPIVAGADENENDHSAEDSNESLDDQGSGSEIDEVAEDEEAESEEIEKKKKKKKKKSGELPETINCTVCNKVLNSRIQYDIHVNSKVKKKFLKFILEKN